LRWSVLRRLGWGYREAGGVVLAGVAVSAIVVNALFLQAGPHPAPMFKSAFAPPAAVEKDTSVGALQRSREAAPTRPGAAASKPEAGKAEPATVAKPMSDVIANVQRELARRGFYDGTVDGLHGPKTDAAIREFEQAAGLKPSTELNAALLRAISGSNVKSPKAATASSSRPPSPPSPVRGDPINEVLAPSKRVAAVQRALADYGYGQIRPTGVLDRETRTAIERFERTRKLPVTGAISERLTRELATVTGRPLE
jgi:peptidoglycan hydrolase-like protein with peptidoglycan-binding domain